MNRQISSSNFLTLDLGTHTGWALYDSGGSITSGTINFTPQRFEGGGMRFLRFKRWLDEIHALNGGLSEVWFEEVRRHLGVDASHVYGGSLGHLTAWCERHTIPYAGIPVGTLKKQIAGKGNANKREMIAAVKALGYHPVDDNEVDALALLHYRLQVYKAG